MAILPSAVAADAALSELAREGVTAGAVRILVGEDAALRIDGRGKHHGLVARIYRLVQFTQMDQAPDFRRYELRLLRTAVTHRQQDGRPMPILCKMNHQDDAQSDENA